MHKLVKSQAFSSGLDDSSSGGFGESEGGNGQLRAVKNSLVIGHGSNDDGDSLPRLIISYLMIALTF